MEATSVRRRAFEVKKPAFTLPRCSQYSLESSSVYGCCCCKPYSMLLARRSPILSLNGDCAVAQQLNRSPDDTRSVHPIFTGTVSATGSGVVQMLFSCRLRNSAGLYTFRGFVSCKDESVIVAAVSVTKLTRAVGHLQPVSLLLGWSDL